MRYGENALAVTTGLMRARGRSVLVGVESAGIEPAYPSVPPWGFRSGLSKCSPNYLLPHKRRLIDGLPAREEMNHVVHESNVDGLGVSFRSLLEVHRRTLAVRACLADIKRALQLVLQGRSPSGCDGGASDHRSGNTRLLGSTRLAVRPGLRSLFCVGALLG